MICTPYHILFGDQMEEVEMMRWVERVARVGGREEGRRFWCENRKESDD